MYVCGSDWFTHYGPVKHWVHCKLTSHPPHQISPCLLLFTVLVTCSDELAVHLTRFFAYRGRLRNWGVNSTIGLCCVFHYWPLLRNNNMATNLRRCTWSYSGRRFATCHNWTQTSWQVMQRARQRSVTANRGKPRRFIAMVGELRLADIFCVVLLDE